MESLTWATQLVRTVSAYLRPAEGVVLGSRQSMTTVHDCEVIGGGRMLFRAEVSRGAPLRCRHRMNVNNSSLFDW